MSLDLITLPTVLSMKAIQVSKRSTGEFDMFACRPVWIVELRNGSKLVVKQEIKGFETAGRSAVFGAKMMKSIDGATKAAPLTDLELAVLSNLRTFVMGRPGGIAPTSAISREYLRLCMQNSQGVWIKMAFVDNLIGLDKVFEDDNKTRNLLMDMRIDGRICESIGEVVAVDIFSGNEDRFAHSGRNLGQIVNTGNILFTSNINTKGIGLDWFQAQGEFSNLYSDPGPDWPGPLLNNDQELTRFSLRAIADLNGGFSDKLADLQRQDLLTPMSAENFKDGIISGRDKLKTYLLDKITKDATNRTNKVPGGVKIRMQKLGWLAV